MNRIEEDHKRGWIKVDNYIKLPVNISTVRVSRPKLRVYYPQVKGLKDKGVQDRINKKIYKETDKLIKEQGYYENPLTEVTGYYEIKTNQRNVLSLSLINYAFSGGAHGLTLIRSLTFDIDTGKEYQLSELFKAGSNYRQRLSEIIREQIKEREIPLLGEFEGIRADQDYYIADKSLVIYFALYEIAPYVYGLPHFPISIYEIEDIIAEGSPLARMFG
jgi:hypothetical protein